MTKPPTRQTPTPSRWHWLRHLMGWAPSEFVCSIAGGVAIKVRCTICGRETWLE